MDSAEAVELVTFVGLTLDRLASLEATHPFESFGTLESSWLLGMRQALDRVESDWDLLRAQCRQLPELESLQQQTVETAQRLVVASLEALEASISTQLSTRAPILEVLFGKLQLPKLARQQPDAFALSISEFEKRLSGAYATRMFADPSFLFAGPALASLTTAIAQWRATLKIEPLEESVAAGLRSSLARLGQEASKVLAQSRLIAEAALIDSTDILESSGLAQKPKRRVRLQASAEVPSPAAPALEPLVPEPVETAPEPKQRRKRA
jgi:hypothetical protein